jgi:hypothetical protein
MLRWSFETYVSSTGRNDVQATIDRYDDYAKQALSRAVAHLAISGKSQWNEPHAKKLQGKHQLYEIRYKADRCATRAIGYFADEATFVITLICTHKQNVYSPHDALSTAERRARQHHSGEATSATLKIDGEDVPPNEG